LAKFCQNPDCLWFSRDPFVKGTELANESWLYNTINNSASLNASKNGVTKTVLRFYICTYIRYLDRIFSIVHVCTQIYKIYKVKFYSRILIREVE
jgi:hypothetical protein